LAERVSGEMGHPRPFWYSAAMFLLYGLPWTPFLAAALVSRGKWAGEKVFLAAWCLVPVVFFSLPATKLPSYILPALPAAAILIAAWWQGLGRLTGAGRLSAALLALVLLVYPALLIIKPGLTPGLEGLAPAVALLGLSTALLCAAAALTRRPWPAFAAAAALLPVLMLVAGLQVERLPLRSYRPLGLEVAGRLSAGDSVATYRCTLYSLPFYTRTRVIEAGMKRPTQFETGDPSPWLPSAKEFLASWERRGRTYCVLREHDLGDFAGRGFRVLGRQRKLVLISNEPKAGGG
jgi:4-amino-4-deoxy-L-arabinose transferase-like glycosyltransferase